MTKTTEFIIRMLAPILTGIKNSKSKYFVEKRFSKINYIHLIKD